jgi:hypothetical protein
MMKWWNIKQIMFLTRSGAKRQDISLRKELRPMYSGGYGGEAQREISLKSRIIGKT